MASGVRSMGVYEVEDDDIGTSSLMAFWVERQWRWPRGLCVMRGGSRVREDLASAVALQWRSAV